MRKQKEEQGKGTTKHTQREREKQHAQDNKTPFRLSIGLIKKITRFSAIHFQGWFIRQVSCYTLLSGFLLPWPPSCCQNEPTPFLVSGMSVQFGHRNSTFGSSHIASSAYQRWPTKDLSICPLFFFSFSSFFFGFRLLLLFFQKSFFPFRPHTFG